MWVFGMRFGSERFKIGGFMMGFGSEKSRFGSSWWDLGQAGLKCRFLWLVLAQKPKFGAF